MVKNINHITFAVRNLDESFDFYTKVLGFFPLARWDKGIYLLAGELWICLSLDTRTRKEKIEECSHTAFTVAEEGFRKLSSRILESGAEIWKENASEGVSLYFLDPNGHKLEIHVGNWRSRLESCMENPFPGMVFFNI